MHLAPLREAVGRRIFGLFCLLMLGCSANSAPPSPPPIKLAERPAADPTPRPVLQPVVSGPLAFEDVASTVGLAFRNHSPLSAERHVHLFLGTGIGWLDYDRDGWPDLYCCQGATYPAAADVRQQQQLPSDALFRNRSGRDFAEVTRHAGVTNDSYSMGVAAADYDNDGFIDFCVTGHAENRLFRNNGDGSFTRVPLPFESDPGRLSAGCAWADIDADGNLDLYIANYAQLGPDNYPTCQHTAAGVTIPISCHPVNLEARHDLLYRNTGSGEFEEISAVAGINEGHPRAGLGVVAADLDADGDIDFYVANDTTENYLWENQGDGRFVDRGTASGTSRNRHGANEAGMGLLAGDITGNGRIDLFVTNYYGETNTLYRNEGDLQFADVTDELGLGAPSRARLAFGTSLSDFDSDGWLDLIVANGHVHDLLPKIGRNEPFDQLPLLFHNDRGRRFQDVASGGGAFFRTTHVGRSTAIADFDRDGRPDVVVNSLNEDAALLRNDSRSQGNWIRIELVGRESNRVGVGAVLRLDLGERTLVRCLHAGTGYLSSDETAMLIGLGACDTVRRLTVEWPGGRREEWSSLQANRLWRLVEGTGNNADSTP